MNKARLILYLLGLFVIIFTFYLNLHQSIVIFNSFIFTTYTRFWGIIIGIFIIAIGYNVERVFA